MSISSTKIVTLKLPPLHPAQEIVHSSKARFKILSCGRRWGKTSLGFAEAAEIVFRGGRVWWVAPTYAIANIGWRLFKRNFEDVARYINKTDMMMEFPGGGEIWFKSADNPDSLRGEGLNAVFFDEAAYIKDEVWYEVIKPMLARDLGTAMFMSSPNGVGNFFHALYVMGQPEYRKTVDAEDDEYESWIFPTETNPHIPRKEIRSAKRELTDLVFRQEWLGEFVADGASVFKNINGTCVLKEQSYIPGHNYIAGIDWGSRSDFTVVSIFDANTREQVKLWATTKSAFSDQYNDIQDLCNEYKISRILVEENSIGLAPFEALQQRGLPVIAFQTTNQTKFEIVSKMIHAMDTGKIKLLNDKVLIEELKTFEATRTPTGMWKYAAKGNNHDDRVMATLLAVSLIETSSVVLPTAQVVIAPREALAREKKEYDLYKGVFYLSYGRRT